MKFLFTNRIIDQNLSNDFENLNIQAIGENSLLINDPSSITDVDNLLSVTNGYLRNYTSDSLVLQKKIAAKHVFENWPVADHITGSFSTFIIDKDSSDFVITSDLCNVYPLYYLLHEDQIFISNSIILIGRYSGAGTDKTGIFQRATGPNFCNIGSRTVLENCKRLLPGEWLKFDSRGRIIFRKFDNSLYQNLSPEEIKKDDIAAYWKHYKKETALCGLGYNHVNIALSGGIDSRIVLGSIENKEISAYTYGNPENYESKIAKKLAESKGASHDIHFDLNQYFPTKNILYHYSKNTEAINLNSWLEILENVNPTSKEPLFLGELCEALPGRNIQKLNTGDFRKKNFFRYYVNNEGIELTPSSEHRFKRWKEKKINFILSWHVDFWFEKLNFSDSKMEIIDNTIRDSEEIFKRIEAHNLPFTELFDELFSWYTYTRMVLSRQVNICNEKFYAYSPGMSLQMLIKTSNIHPNQRLYYRFANKLLKSEPELKKFGKIPTSQIPFIPQTFPNILKVPVWGLRSKIDDWLIKRMMKNKDIRSRYRLFESINWPQVYQQKDMLINLQGYYKSNELTDEYFKIFSTLAHERKSLNKWPFANMDIISGAALNAEIDLIKNYPE